MTNIQFSKRLVFILIIFGIFSNGNGQTPSKPVLPAPAKSQAVERSSRAADESHGDTNRIVGGAPSSGRPFMAALVYEKEGKLYQYCGASVIGDRWLLTAAHCKVKKGEFAIINRSNLSLPGTPVAVAHDAYEHSQYNPDTHDNDIAVVRLIGDISQTIPRIKVRTAPPVGTKVLVAGWGLTSENGKQSLILREVEIPLISNIDCKSKYSNLTANMICAEEEGKDSCQGDSGGPLFLANDDGIQQFGIVSYGVGCGRKGWPGVYSRVDQYREWITATMSNPE